MNDVRLKGTPKQGLLGATLGFFIGFTAVSLLGLSAKIFQDFMNLTPVMVGLLVSIFQATTSIQEQTLTFVPKVVAIFLSIIIFSNWMLSTLIEFTKRIFNLIPMMTR